MPIKNEMPDPRLAEMRTAFLEDSGDLWDNNQDRFMALLNNSELKAVKLTFTATIDRSESEAGLEVDMGYGQRFKDKRKRTFGDPNQAELPGIGTRPGTGLPEMNGHAKGEVNVEAGGDTPADYKARHPEEFAAEKPKRGRKAKAAA